MTLRRCYTYERREVRRVWAVTEEEAFAALDACAGECSPFLLTDVRGADGIAAASVPPFPPDAPARQDPTG